MFHGYASLIMCLCIAILTLVAIPISMDLAYLIWRTWSWQNELGSASSSNLGPLIKLCLLCLFGALVGPLSILVTISTLSIDNFYVLKRTVAPDEPGQMDVFSSYRITPTILIYSLIGLMVSFPFLRQTRRKAGGTSSTPSTKRMTALPSSNNHKVTSSQINE